MSPGPEASLRPSWSPDGQTLAFYQESQGHIGLWVWSSRAGARSVGNLQIHPRRWPGDAPVWLDANHVAVGVVRPVDRNWLRTMVAPTQADLPRVLTTDPKETPPDLMWQRANIVEPVEVDLRDGHDLSLPLPSDQAQPTLTRVSPSGRWLVYLTTFRFTRSGVVSDLLIGARDGSQPWHTVSGLKLEWNGLSAPLQWHPKGPFICARRATLARGRSG